MARRAGRQCPAIIVTFFSDKAAATKREQVLDLTDLARRIETTTGPDKAHLPWLKCARFGDSRTDKNSLRHDANLIAITGVEADYDGEVISFPEAQDALRAAGLLAVLYTSPSHTEDSPRWRVLCPFSQEYPPEQRDRFLARLSGLFRGVFSRESWTLSQSYYYGSVRQNPSHRVAVLDGTPLDLAHELDVTAIGRPEKPNGAAMREMGPAPTARTRTQGEMARRSPTDASTARSTACWTTSATRRRHQAPHAVGQRPRDRRLSAPDQLDRRTGGRDVRRGAAGDGEGLEPRPTHGRRCDRRGQAEAARAGEPARPAQRSVPAFMLPRPPPDDIPLPEPEEREEHFSDAEQDSGGPAQDGELRPDPDGRATAARPDEPAELPVIICAAGQLPRMVVEAEAALLAANVAIYQRGVLVRPAEVEYPASHGRTTHSAALIAITAPSLTKLLALAAVFMKFDARKGRNVVCDPPPKLVDIILASRGDWRFPVVRGVLTSPTLRPDGSLLITPGYDERSRYYLMFPSNLVLPPIPDRPTRDEALASLARLNALLDGYPFVDDVSRTVAVSLLMTQVLRCAMTVSPMHAVSATAPSSGKSHLVDLASHIAIGRFCPIMGPGKSDEETEKGINTKLISGTPAFSIDNVHRALDIPALNIATERPLITVRVFGTLTDVEIENAVTIFMTGNNLAIIDEQMRRTVRCVLDAKTERPDLRTFTGDPTDAVLADRGRYLADILTIARAYLTNGTRPDIPPLGSYGDWSRFVREPLVWLGCADPVKSMETLREDDPATIRLGTIINAWHVAFGLGAKTLAEAASYATTAPIPHAVDADADERHAYHAHRASQEQLFAALREAFAAPRDGIDTNKWGYWMRKFKGRVAGGMRFEKADSLSHQAVQWKLAKS